MHFVLIAFITMIGISGIVYMDQHGDIEKAKAGLQECVVETSIGNSRIVWQKECK